MKMKKSMWLASLAALAVLGSCRKELSNPGQPAAPASQGKSSAQNELVETTAPNVKTVQTGLTTNVSGYYVGLPAHYDSTTKNYPLLVFIHGIGELSSANKGLSVVTNVGTARLLNQRSFPASFNVKGKAYSFIVVAPQFKNWPTAADLNSLIDKLIQQYRVDASRIYVAGLSMGGGVTWDFAGDFTSKVAAIVPISGAGYPDEKRATNIANGHVAVWAFHNSGDKVVAASISKQYVDKINGHHASPAAKLTTFTSNDHDAWTKATDPNYKENGMNIYEWMLQYSKSASN